MNQLRLEAHEALKARRARMMSPPPRIAPAPPPLPMVRVCSVPAPPVVPNTPSARIVVLVAEHYGLTWADLTGPSHRPSVSHPRQVAMVLVLGLTHLGLTRTAGALGRVNHTTVLHAARAVDRRCAADPVFAEEFARLRAAARTVLNGK